MKNQKGFTLVELMVAITIVAILAVVGFTLFSGLQRSARDSNRTTEINAIANALETHYIAAATSGNPITCDGAAAADAVTGSSYCPLRAAWFQRGVIPADPNGGVYCLYQNSDATSAGAFTPLTSTAGWTGARDACPAVANSSPAGAAVAAGNPPATVGTLFKNFMVCVKMEATDQVYCVTNQQR